MTHNHFTYRELLSFGWEKTKQHYWFLLGVALICLIIGGATMALPIIHGIISLLLTVAVIYLTLMIVDGHTPAYKDMLKPFTTYKITLNSIIATILCLLIVLVGFILLILPGVYLATRLKFYLYALAEDENLSAVDSLKRSMEITQGIFWKLFFWNILLVIINILGALALGVGLLVTIPTTVIAYTYLYRRLSKHTHPHSQEHHNHGAHEGAHIAAI